MEYVETISALGRVYYPPNRRDPQLNYVFMRLNFQCLSGDSLIELYTGQDLGLSFIYRNEGYPDVFIEDYQGSRYLANLIGVCWLGIPLPKTRAEDRAFTLHFKNLDPVHIEPPAALPAEKMPIAFVSDSDLNTEIYRMLLDGKPAERLTNNAANDTEPAWYPDRSLLAFTTDRDGNAEIYRMDAIGENPLNLSRNPAQEGGAAWRPDGARLAFHTDRDGQWEIYTMRSDGEEQRNLSNSPDADLAASWSPDGSQVVFQTHRDGNWEIYRMQADGSQPIRLTDHPAEDVAPAWSPDGSAIAFWSRRDAGWGLYLMGPSGGDLRLLANYLNPGDLASAPAWSPDGAFIVFATRRDGMLELYQLRLDGLQLTRLTRNTADDYDPDW